ncbi:MAG: hydrogenase maturation nickel metallochaperone HypA [Syntrophorhabdales bacterium]|jgi:hydrogenase nickel incorporation protein HypA/HybF
MHELTITQNIIDIAVKESPDRRVTGINLVIGELSSVVEDSIRFCFDVISRDTPVEGARLSITKIAALLRCASCAREFGLEAAGICPSCGGRGGEVLAGREFYLESIEVED